MGVKESQINNIGSLAKNLAKGGKLNFPQIWKSTSFDRSYDFTVRLYNLAPGDLDAQNKYIIGPMVSLLSFVVPTSEDGDTYLWPLICKMEVPGQCKIDAAYVKTISVVKGGDSNDQAWNNRPGTVDIKISIGDLYTTMISANKKSNPNTPTVKGLVDSMRDEFKDECCQEDEGFQITKNVARPTNIIDNGVRLIGENNVQNAANQLALTFGSVV